MGHPLRWNRTDLLYEVTIETIQGRYLLRPSPEVKEIILGVISKAQELYPAIALYAFVFTRNLGTLILSTRDESQFSKFMAYVDGGISRKLGRLLDWSGKLWAGRYRAVPILDEEAITQRLRHLLSQGVADGLVASPTDWPGATCVPALLGSMRLEGIWVNRDREARLRASGIDPSPSAYIERYRVQLTPLPAWAGLSRQELVGRYRAMVESIEVEHLVITRGVVVGPVELQRQDPFFRPEARRRRRFAQICHSVSATLAEGFRVAFRRFSAAFHAAAAELIGRPEVKKQLVSAFPGGSNPRPALSVPLELAPIPWWNEAPPRDLVGTDTVIDDTAHDLTGEAPTLRWTKRSDRSAPRVGSPADAPPTTDARAHVVGPPSAPPTRRLRPPPPPVPSTS